MGGALFAFPAEAFRTEVRTEPRYRSGNILESFGLSLVAFR